MRSLSKIVLVAVIGLAAIWLVEAVSNPWAHSLTGGPTLVGAWYGTLVTPTGHRGVVALEISPPSRGCATCPDLSAGILACLEPGNDVEYDAWGDAHNWRGTRFSLATRTKDDRPRMLKLGTLEGEWDADSLRLKTTLRSDLDRHPDTLKPITFTLQRSGGQDFWRECESLE